MQRACLLWYPRHDRALYYAVYYNNLSSVKKLLRVPHVDPKNAIRLAAERGYTKMLKLMRAAFPLPLGKLVWSVILRHCDARTVCRLRQTCTRLNALGKAENVWARILKADYDLRAKERGSLAVYRDLHGGRICRQCQAPIVYADEKRQICYNRHLLN